MLATYRSLPLSHCAADWTFSSSVRPARVPFRPGTPVQNQTPGNPTAYRAHVPPLHAGVNFSHGGHPPEMLHALPVPPCPPPSPLLHIYKLAVRSASTFAPAISAGCIGPLWLPPALNPHRCVNPAGLVLLPYGGRGSGGAVVKTGLGVRSQLRVMLLRAVLC